MTETAPGLICGHPINLTLDRVEFHQSRPQWEGPRIESCHELMQPGWIVYDLGAECGDFSALYQKWVGPEGGVVLVEPQPRSWPHIYAHFQANDLPDPLHMVPAFAGDTRWWPPRSEKFTDEDARLIGEHTTGAVWPPCTFAYEVVPDFGFRHYAQQTVNTPTITCDLIAESSGFVPDAIVMDIEGAEWHALLGCGRLLAGEFGKKPLIWCSVHQDTLWNWYGKRYADILRLVDDRGYKARLLGTHAEHFWLFSPKDNEA